MCWRSAWRSQEDNPVVVRTPLLPKKYHGRTEAY
jgi:hypothetical protein